MKYYYISHPVKIINYWNYVEVKHQELKVAGLYDRHEYPPHYKPVDELMAYTTYEAAVHAAQIATSDLDLTDRYAHPVFTTMEMPQQYESMQKVGNKTIRAAKIKAPHFNEIQSASLEHISATFYKNVNLSNVDLNHEDITRIINEQTDEITRLKEIYKNDFFQKMSVVVGALFVLNYLYKTVGFPLTASIMYFLTLFLPVTEFIQNKYAAIQNFFQTLIQKVTHPELSTAFQNFLKSQKGTPNADRFSQEKGYNLQATDSHGNTPLHLAAMYLQSGLVTSLIEVGTDPNVQNRNGETALHCVGHRYSLSRNPGSYVTRQKIVQCLLDNDADPNLCDQYGQTPLHEATSSGIVSMINALVDRGATPNIPDQLGHSPYTIAKNSKNVDPLIFRELLGTNDSDSASRDYTRSSTKQRRT
jgi:hypothetical protein